MESIVLARGVAAALIVFHHAGNVAAEPRFFGENAFGGLLTQFFASVSFFFVLSGFFIGWVNWKSIGVSEAARGFAVKRMSRIYPSYWVVLTPLVVLYQIFPEASIPSQRDPLNIILSYLLLPYPGGQPVLGVAWTLVHEVLFCIVFALAIFFGRAAIPGLIAWAGAIILAQMSFSPLPYPLAFLLEPSNLQFLMGLALARLIKERAVPAPALLLAVGTAAFLGFISIGAWITTDYFLERVILGISSCLIVAGLIGLERERPIRLPKSPLVFGVASFSIYLIHPLALSLGAHMLVRLPVHGLPVELIVLVMVVGAIAAGVMFHLAIEAPLGRRVRGWVEGREKSSAALART